MLIRARTWVVAAGVIAAVLGVVAGAALLLWPRPEVVAAGDALARIRLSGFAGSVAAIEVRAPDGTPVPARLRQGKLWPLRPLAAGERLTVTLTVRRPGWAGWLVGHTVTETVPLETPVAHLLGRWLQVKTGAPVTIAFEQPVSRVALGGRAARLAKPRTVVPVGVIASGSHTSGTVEVAAAARAWELLSAPVRVSWFPARPYPQLLVEPRPASPLAPADQLTLTFSRPVQKVLGSRRPSLTPATAGRWHLLDAHTLAFRPRGFGFGLGATVRIVLPRAAHLAGSTGERLMRTLSWHVPAGSTLRLQQLLAELGYLPLDWQPTAGSTATLGGQLEAAISPPPGRFGWRYPNTPRDLRALWRAGEPNQITRGAVMMFEHTHGLAVDAVAGPNVWRALLADALAGKRRGGGYSYVYIQQRIPQALNLWHNGHLILSSPGNTGIPAAPTQPGTFPVFEHIPVGTMSGTNPDGSHYHDPGIRYVSYFHGGDAIHAFNRASFGTPQSLGCVELPLAAAAKVWPYTPIGTLVTIEN